jgi:hypothetical protein
MSRRARTFEGHRPDELLRFTLALVRVRAVMIGGRGGAEEGEDSSFFSRGLPDAPTRASFDAHFKGCA